MEVIQAKQQLAADHGDVSFSEYTRLQKVEAGTAREILHDNPKFVSNDEGAIIPGDIVRIALSKAGDFLLYFGDVIIRVLQICCKNASLLQCRSSIINLTNLLDSDYLLSFVVNSLEDCPKAASTKFLQ